MVDSAKLICRSLAQASILLLGIASGYASDGPLPPICRGPYLQCATPYSIHIVWRTEWERITPVIRFGKTPTTLDRIVTGKDVVIKASLQTNKNSNLERLIPLRTRANLSLPKLHSAPPGTFQYEALVSGLEPATRYYYAVFDGEKRLTPQSESYHFITMPLPGTATPIRFWAFGDSGSNRKSQYMVYEAIMNRVHRDGRPLDFVLHLGDFAYYDGRDLEFTVRYFKPYEELLRNMVVWPTFANHEAHTSRALEGIGPYFDAFIMPTHGEAGGIPSHREGYYSFDCGRAHFICLDSHELRHKLRRQMSDWLKADLELAKKRGQTDWLIAFFHQPPYTKGSHDSDKEGDLVDMRKHYIPILEAGGVDLVLNGHSHIYERSMLMDGNYGTNNTVADNFILDDGDGNPNGDGPYRKSAGINPRQGTVYVVAGNAGARLTRRALMPVMAITYVEFGSLLVDIQGDTLTGTMINKFGDLRDQFQIVKRGEVITNKLSHPWLLPDWKGLNWNTDEEWDVLPPVAHKLIVPDDATWQYYTTQDIKGRDWTWPNYDASRWKSGPAPLGFNYDKVRTKLDSMFNKSTVVYLRKEFVVEDVDRMNNFGLVIDYDDGFIAYLNGREVARRNIDRGRGRYALTIKEHRAYGQYEWVAFKDWQKYLQNGRNVICIEGHNSKPDSDSFLVYVKVVAEQ